MHRWLLNSAAVFSFLLCLGAAAQWVDSHSTWRAVGFPLGGRTVMVSSQNGELVFLLHPDLMDFHVQTGSSRRVMDGTDLHASLRSYTRKWAGFIVPHWAFVFLLSILPAIRIIKWRKQRMLARIGKSPDCAYDLTGKVTRERPECEASTKGPT